MSTTDFFKGIIVNDDRAYYWRADGDVVFSEEMQAWLGKLKAEFDGIVSDETESVPVPEYMRELIFALSGANEQYRNIFAFRDMFYDL